MKFKLLKIRPEVPDDIEISSKGISVNYYDRLGQKVPFPMVVKKAFIRYYNYWLDFEIAFLDCVGDIRLWSVRKFFYELAGVRMGRGTKFYFRTRFYNPKNIEVGEDSLIGDNCFLDGRNAIIIGNHVDIASQVLIYNEEHNVHSEKFEATSGPVEIGDYVFVGPRAIILPGIKIGRGAIVAAGAVVTHDVPEMTIVGGVPAKEIGVRKVKDLNYKLGRARLFQ